MKKSLLILLLTLLGSTSLHAYDAYIDGIYYNFSGNEATVTYNSRPAYSSSTVTIPETVIYNGTTYSVTAIGEEAFINCSSVTSVTIPNSMKSIGIRAFQNCTGLLSITIPNSVTSIGASAFYGCNLASVTIGAGVLSIGDEAFPKSPSTRKKVTWLTNTPPDGYQKVNAEVNYVSNNLFEKLNNVIVYPFLSSMFVVDGVKYVPVNPSERTCDAIDCVYDESAENINIGETVTYRGISLTLMQIRPYLCYKNKFVKEVKLSFKGDVAYSAFEECTALCDATIQNKGDLKYAAFKNCYVLQNVVFGPEIKFIGNQAFSRCSSLEGISIPNSVDSLGACAFEYCYAMSSAKIGNGLKTIPEYAFYDCTSLTDLQIANGIKLIRRGALVGCSSLPTIQIPMSVTAIEDFVFNGCTGLKTVLIADGDTELHLGGGEYNSSSPFFRECPLDSVYIGRIITYPQTSESYSPFYSNKSLRTVTFANKEMEISAYEFASCSQLQAVKLSTKTKSIGDYAFGGCSSLKSIVIPNEVDSIGYATFRGCSAMTSVKIGSRVKALPTSTFSGCASLPTIRIPGNVTRIEDYVFANCVSLKNVLIDDGEAELVLGSDDIYPMFSSCPLDSVYIGRNITYSKIKEKGYSPFYRNTALRSVTITNRETEISTNEFYGCTNLKNVRIGDGVATIGEWAFSGCSSLDTFSFGSKVENIGQEAFSDCTAMTRLISRATTPPVCGSQALDDVNKWFCVLTVPKGCVSTYQQADQWKEFFFIEGEDGEVPPVIPDPEPDVKKCTTPTISYANGQLKFESETEGVEFKSSIRDTDINDYTASFINLTATYTITVYATKEDYENSDTATATLCWIDVEPATEGLTDEDSVAEVKTLPVLIQTHGGTITVQGAAEGTNVSVYSVNGMLQGSTISDEGIAILNTSLQPGSIAVVKIGEKSVKVLMK